MVSIYSNHNVIMTALLDSIIMTQFGVVLHVILNVMYVMDLLLQIVIVAILNISISQILENVELTVHRVTLKINKPEHVKNVLLGVVVVIMNSLINVLLA